MDSHLNYIQVHQVHDNHAEGSANNLAVGKDFVVNTSGLTDDCTFEISFTEAYFEKHREN